MTLGGNPRFFLSVGNVQRAAVQRAVVQRAVVQRAV